jgi:iron complex transport system substrate-binding protein
MSKLVTVLVVVALIASLTAVGLSYLAFTQLSSKIEESTGMLLEDIRGVSSRVEEVSSLARSVAGSIKPVEERLSRVESKLAELGERSSLIEDRLSRVEGLAARLGEEVRGLVGELEESRVVAELSARPRVSVEYARLFRVTYDGPVKIVEDAEGQTLLLIPRALRGYRDLISFYVEKYDPDSVIYTPVERVVLMSATQVAMLYRLETECGVELIESSVVGLMWGGGYKWHVEKVARLLEEGVIEDVGSSSSPDIERILKLEPDVVVIYTYAGSPVFSNLRDAGLPVAVDNEYLEKSILGRFEWLKFLALFYDLEACAESIFKKVESELSSLAATIANSVPSLENRTVIAWFLVFGGNIYAPKPVSYVADMISLAGGVYAFSDIPLGRPTPEYIVARGESIDVLVYSSSKEYGPQTIEDLVTKVEFVKHIKAVREGRVYVFAPTYWQLGTAHPEILVKDIAAILYPEIFGDHELTFFEKLE